MATDENISQIPTTRQDEPATSDSQEELAAFLQEAHTPNPAFDEGFLSLVENFLNWAKETKVLPQELSGWGIVQSRLAALLTQIQDEQDRLKAAFEEFDATRREIQTRFSEEEAQNVLDSKAAEGIIPTRPNTFA